jgi:hypothetical protein
VQYPIIPSAGSLFKFVPRHASINPFSAKFTAVTCQFVANPVVISGVVARSILQAMQFAVTGKVEDSAREQGYRKRSQGPEKVR